MQIQIIYSHTCPTEAVRRGLTRINAKGNAMLFGFVEAELEVVLQ